VAEGFMEHPSLAVLNGKDERLGLLAPGGIRFHQDGNRRVALEFGVEFVIGLEVSQALGDRGIGFTTRALNGTRGPWPDCPLPNSGRRAWETLPIP